MAGAADDYFTWVDAEGRIHNSSRPQTEREAETDKPSRPPVDNAAESRYLSEDELQKKLQQERQQHKPFYVWVDEQGVVHNQETLQGTASDKETDDQEVLTDHTLIPPLRVSAAIRNAGCCQEYRNAFHVSSSRYEPLLLQRAEAGIPFRTSSGQRPAWYFTLRNFPASGEAMLSLRLRRSTDRLALIALGENLKPLYYLPEVRFQLQAETWSHEAYREAVISVQDKALRAVILYFPDGTSNAATAEVEWR